MTNNRFTHGLIKALSKLLPIIGIFCLIVVYSLSTHWVEYTNETFQILLELPEDWTVVENMDSVRLVSPNANSLEIYVDHQEYYVKSGNTLQILENFLAQTMFPGMITEEPIQDYTLNGYRAAVKRILMEYEVNLPAELRETVAQIAIPQYELVIVAVQDVNRQAILVMVEDNPDWYDNQLNPQLERIIRSFRFQ